MPLRPSVYRSFVTCSDPEGVINCGSVRRSSLENMENGVVTQNMPKSLNMCSSGGSSGDGVGKMRNSSSQLEEIEKGAQKLNKMIDSWATGLSIDGESKDIAQDLLRGALDLQESLNMLSKLQEASMFMAKLKRLEKHDEKGRVSVDGSARSKCVEEVTKVKQDSPMRQHLLHVETNWDRRGMSWTSEGQSSSSAQSSVNFSKKDCSTDNSSVSSDTSVKNRKRPNLIAKLMGLDDRKHVRATTPSTSNEVHVEKKLPVFDCDVPESKKPHVLTETRYQEKRTLRELLEATETKANLESKFVERLSRVGADKFPPIVLMKPLHIPFKESEKNYEQYFDASKIVMELKAKNWYSHEQDQVSEKVSLMKNDTNSKSTPQILKHEMRKLPKTEVANIQRTKVKIKEKAVISMQQTSRATKISKNVRSTDVSKSSNNVSKEKSVSSTKLVVPKEANASTIKKASSSVNNQSITKAQTSIPRKLPQTTTKEASKEYSVGVKKTQKRKGKPVIRPLSGDALRYEDGVAAMNLPCKIKTKTIAEEVAEVEENWKDVEVMHDTSVQERSSCQKVVSSISCLKSRAFQENLLMSSPSFTGFIEVIFNLDLSSTSSKAVAPSIEMDADATLFISYAKEVLQRRSSQLLFSATYMGIPVLLNQLIDEVCEAYDAIYSYKDETPTVDIFDILDRDMKCKEVVSSAWDLGWKSGHSNAETEQIAANLEKLILRDFIDEIFAH